MIRKITLMKKERISVIVLLAMLLLSRCGEEKSEADKFLYDMAKDYTGFNWYRKSSELLERSEGSGHNFPYLRTRFNAEAFSQLNADGTVPDTLAFPVGSLIVKELFNDNRKLERYAMLYKDPANPDADAKGWVWGYIEKGGRVVTSSSDKGEGCSWCHEQNGNLDYLLMGKYFP